LGKAHSPAANQPYKQRKRLPCYMGSERVNKQRKGLALQTVSAVPHNSDKYGTKEKQQTLCALL
jgi:hypothetical protein